MIKESNYKRIEEQHRILKINYEKWFYKRFAELDVVLVVFLWTGSAPPEAGNMRWGTGIKRISRLKLRVPERLARRGTSDSAIAFVLIRNREFVDMPGRVCPGPAEMLTGGPTPGRVLRKTETTSSEGKEGKGRTH
jgi:hypothetical protein